jgi:hypothetical protein
MEANNFAFLDGELAATPDFIASWVTALQHRVGGRSSVTSLLECYAKIVKKIRII